jgi:hypothetical protein
MSLQYHSDITLIPPRAAAIDCIDEHIARQVRYVAAERDKAVRELARPYLAAGYLPDELTVIERHSDFIEPDRLFVCVQVTKRRHRIVLFLRRVLWALGFCKEPWMEGYEWRG